MPADKKIKTIRILLIVTFLVLLIMGTIALYTIGIVKGNIYWVQHTKDVLQVSDELYASTLEAESNSRGYAITHDSIFKGTYERAKFKTYDLVDSLHQLSSDNYSQQQNITYLRQAIDEKMNHLDSAVVIAEASVSEKFPVFNGREKQGLLLASEIKQKLDGINKMENMLLRARNRGLSSKLNTLPAILLFSTLIGIGIAGLSLYTVIQYNRHRLQSQKAIHLYQQQLTEQIARLNISNKELEQFAYVASHDLQEPLRKIIAFSELLNEQYKDRLDGDGAIYLNRIVNSSTRMRKLINDLLNYSRVGRKVTQEEDVCLTELIPLIIDDLEILIAEKKADISMSALPVVKGNISEIRQLFQNLLVNALKFSRPDATSEIRITSHPAGRELVARFPSLDPMGLYHAIQISDNGIGFDQQYAERIFVIFQRLHGKDKYEGTGIGLAVCKKIVEKLHGEIFAESVPEKGASFTVLLPIPTPQA